MDTTATPRSSGAPELTGRSSSARPSDLLLEQVAEPVGDVGEGEPLRPGPCGPRPWPSRSGSLYAATIAWPSSRGRARRHQPGVTRPSAPTTGAMAKATTGVPTAIASSTALGEPSDRELNTKTSAAATSAGGVRRQPSRCTAPSRP